MSSGLALYEARIDRVDLFESPVQVTWLDFTGGVVGDAPCRSGLGREYSRAEPAPTGRVLQ